MRIFCIALGLVSLLIASRQSVAQAVVTLNEEQLEKFKVVEVKLMEKQLFACTTDLQVFSENDFDRDGRLDDWCVGVRYDPCNIHTLQIAVIRHAMSGGYGCESLADIEAREARQAQCNGFSPTPSFCQ